MACANSLFPKLTIMYLMLQPGYFVWIKKPYAFVKYVIKFMEEYVKNNKQYIYIQAYLIPNLDYLSHRIKSYVVYIDHSLNLGLDMLEEIFVLFIVLHMFFHKFDHILNKCGRFCNPHKMVLASSVSREATWWSGPLLH